jgi:hypothetical protein
MTNPYLPGFFRAVIGGLGGNIFKKTCSKASRLSSAPIS